MENHKESIKSILTKGSDTKAPAGLSSSVMATWKAETKPSVAPSPLIPSWVWWTTGSGIIALMAWLLNTSMGNSPSGRLLNFIERYSPHVELSVPQLSPVILTAASVLALMILMNVVIIKYRSESQHSY